MTKVKLLALKGLPASGKSTYAKTLEEQGWVRTNKDTIRLEYFDNYNYRKDEKKVIKIRNQLIEEALQQNKDVVIDDTNLNPVHTKELAAIARKYGAEFKIDDSFLQVSLTECIERDKHREASVGENVIRKMYHEWIAKKLDGSEINPKLPICVISDIDGTLAHMNGKRGPYDWHKVGSDDLDHAVAKVLDGLRATNDIGDLYKIDIFLFSGRDEVCRPETEAWLDHYCISYDKLYMRRSDHLRPDGGQVADTEVKREIYEKYIKDKYNVLFIMDDRPQVCRMWRDEFGLRVMNLGDPYLEF